MEQRNQSIEISNEKEFSSTKKEVRNSKTIYLKKIITLIGGLFLFSIGIVLSIQANVGLAPWDAFSIGIANITNSTYGHISIITGFIFLIIVVLMKEKFGIGTLLNIVLIGFFADLILSWNIIPVIQNFWLGILILFLGQIIISIASYFYIGSGLGAGPRDSFMIALKKRLPRIPIGVIRGGIEMCALLVGWLFGAKVGLGTVIAVFGIGFIIQITFKLLKFDVKKIKHESIIETFNNLKR